MSQYFSRNEPRILIALQEHILPGGRAQLADARLCAQLLSYE
jgi:hypothetical protein